MKNESCFATCLYSPDKKTCPLKIGRLFRECGVINKDGMPKCFKKAIRERNLHLVIQPIGKNCKVRFPVPYIVDLKTGDIVNRKAHKNGPAKFIWFCGSDFTDIITYRNTDLLSRRFLNKIQKKRYKILFRMPNYDEAEVNFPNGYTLSIKEK